MSEHGHARTNGNGAELVRARLLTALHVGRLRPGDRVVSIRRLADLTGVNHKAVHRAYTTLAREGFLEVRPGSGTFVADRRSSADGLPSVPALLEAVEHCRDEAQRLGLEPEELSRFLDVCLAGGLAETTVGLVECNWEQIAMIGEDLRETLHVRVRPILLSTLQGDPERSAGRVASVVTTDCHWTEVANLLEPLGVVTHSVALDQRFPRDLLRLARRGEVIMVLHDPSFGPVFSRLLRQIADGSRVLRNIRFTDEADARETLRTARPGTWVYVSSLVKPSVIGTIPSHLRPVDARWHVEPGALESLRATLALDRAIAESR